MGLTEGQWNEIIEDRKAEYRINPINLYSNRYFRSRRGRRKKQVKAGEILSNLLEIKSMVDFGCGLGAILEGTLQGQTKKVLGIDACYDRSIRFVPECMQLFIQKGHLGRKLDLGKWDCVFSIETAEHLLPEEENTFIDNIMNASSRLIVFRAAMSFNRWHLNPGKSREYWVDLFLKRGCRELFDEEQKLVRLWKGLVIRYIRRRIIIMRVL